MIQVQFPKDFLWGTATSAYQIEGGFNAEGKGASTWDTFTQKSGKIKRNENGNVACDHFAHWKEDVALMQSLSIASYRFSIAWSRVLPEGTGKVNEAGLAFYDRLVDELLAKNILPFVTLYHWDLPQALENKGGWLNRETTFAFEYYSDIVTRKLGDRVKHWITLNEPWIIMVAGYVLGAHAPGKIRPFSSFRVAHNLLLAHGRSMSVIRTNVPGSVAGITNALTPVYSDSRSKESKATKRAHAIMNQLWMDPIFKGHYPKEIESLVLSQNKKNMFPEDWKLITQKTDFLGVNHYSRMIVRYLPFPIYSFFPVTPKYPAVEFTSMGWEVYPTGFSELLRWIREDYDNPTVYITENGISLPDELENNQVSDPRRIHYLQSYLLELNRAMVAGSDVKGYFVWSFLDNFEWHEGYEKRFGIVYVDHSDPKRPRLPKQSAHWYAKLCRDNSFQLE